MDSDENMVERLGALTSARFDDWRKKEFIPHIEREELYEKKVDRLWWTALLMVAVSGYLAWDWKEMKQDIRAVVLSNAAQIEILKNVTEEAKRQAVVQERLLQGFIEVSKNQAQIQGELNGRRR